MEIPLTFIQWKGTDLCMDFWCECGRRNHYDGYFAYAIKCPDCGAVWIMPLDVASLMRHATPEDDFERPLLPVKET